MHNVLFIDKIFYKYENEMFKLQAISYDCYIFIRPMYWPNWKKLLIIFKFNSFKIPQVYAHVDINIF